ncbi:MAG: hypothetical protein HMLKMBBP_00184 [Planctomycetes bacterium]|nr:hypothetical protein [Planctomycetota bacterium]
MLTQSLPRRAPLWRRAAAYLAVFAATVLGAGRALAGDAVKLQFEFIDDRTQINAAESIDVQIVGIDATGARVGFKDLEVSATGGTFTVVRQPFSCRYTAPAEGTDLAAYRLRAWLKARPEVSGEATITVIPPPAYKRLAMTGPGTTPAGAFVDLDLLGENAAGQMVAADPATVSVKVASGPGTITLVKPGRYRLATEVKDTGTSRVVASLVRHPSIQSTVDVVVTGAATPQPQPQPQPLPVPPPTGGSGSSGGGTPPAPPAGGGAGGGTKPVDPPKPVDKNDVVWPSGNIRIGAWRTMAAGDADWSDSEKSMPKPAGEFVARKDKQKLRIVIERKDTIKVELEEWIGDKKGADVKRLDPTKDGRFQLERNKKDQYVIHFEAAPPDNGKPLNLAILLTFADNKIAREEIVLRRDAPEPKK